MNMFKDIDIFDDGWVFLLDGNNSVRDYWINRKEVDKAVISQWLDLLKSRQEYFSGRNIKYINFFAPEKLSIYPDKTDLEISSVHIPSYQLRNSFSGSYSSLNDSVIDVIPYLRSQAERYLCYHKTDSHWNFYGAFSCYQLIQSIIGEPIFSDALGQPRNYNWSVLDLGAKFDPFLKEYTFFYSHSGNLKRSYANDLVKYKEENNKQNDPGLHVGSCVEYINQNSLSDKKMLIFGDSFSEYRPHLLTGLMAETYRSVRFVWSASVDYHQVELFKPDIVICELAERFIPRQVPSDGLNINDLVEKKLPPRVKREK